MKVPGYTTTQYMIWQYYYWKTDFSKRCGHNNLPQVKVGLNSAQDRLDHLPWVTAATVPRCSCLMSAIAPDFDCYITEGFTPGTQLCQLLYHCLGLPDNSIDLIKSQAFPFAEAEPRSRGSINGLRLKA